ncbi:pb1 domain containing protein [Gigaspora margarita]|uniref:Pb1 domain containing protein n=1 Tax=Gigaspora margarita TaxID=4874 RepID=A0A8H4ANL6_GIGMA|nr:pb1 domain containing protein [Gigaspora margarita]
MATIKVTYNSIVRRFTISPDSTWVNLESQLRNLFQIPNDPLNVSYTDEDGDVITISSDLELQEVLSQYSIGKPIKFILTTANHEKDNSNVETKLHESESHPNLEFDSRPPSYYPHVSVTDEETDEFFVNVPEQPKTTKESSEDSNEQVPEQVPEHPKTTKESSEDSNEHNPTRIIFLIRRPWAHSYYSNPQFSLFPFRYGSPFNFYPHGFGYPYASFVSVSPHCGRSFSRCQSTKANNYCSDKKSCNNASNSGSYRGCTAFRDCHNRKFSTEQLSEKVKILNSMGFSSDDNEKYEDLLKRYHGNIDRVIDILFREQEENEKASSSKTNEMKDAPREDEEILSSPVMVEINSENQPYAL